MIRAYSIETCKKLSYWTELSGWLLLHRLLSLAFMESLTIYGLVIALVPAPAVLKTSHDQNQSKMSSEVLLFANPLIK